MFSFMCLSTRRRDKGNKGVGEWEPKDNVLNNTTNYTATFFLRVGRTDLNIYYLHKHLVS